MKGTSVTAALLAAACAAGLAAVAKDRPNALQAQAQVKGQVEERVERNGRVDSARPARAPFQPPITAAKIRRAVDDAVLYLRSAQQPDGSVRSQYREGATALAALAILAAGGDPAGDDSLRRMLAWLAKREVDNTYVRGIRANTWEYTLRKVPYDETIRQGLKTDFEWLMKARADRAAWRYTMGSTDWDNSCSQYGVLGLWAAARAGLQPGDDFWRAMSKHFTGCQLADGGWGYVSASGSSPNMVTAGLASMFLVFDMVHGTSFYSAANPRAFSSGEAAACLKSIARGMDWLGKNGLANQDAYFLYGIERVGVAGGRKYIGGKDWFAEGALSVLQAQAPDGLFRLGGYGDDPVRTAFAVLFLVYGGAPVAYNKLEYGDGTDWNLNPRDLANLCKDLWSAYEQPLNWHSVSLKDSVEEFEAPILFISGSQPARFSGDEVAKLRQYILRGGTILAEPADRSPGFRESMVDLVRHLFPEQDYPDYTLAPLPANHGIWTVLKQSWTRRPALSGMSDGSRTFFFLSDDYLSADWQMNRTDSDAFRLGMNLLFYATDLSTLRGRFASILPASPAAAPRDGAAAVARVRHAAAGSTPMDWAAGPGSWRRFAPYFAHITGRKLEERAAVDLVQPVPKGIHLLHLTGRQPLALSEAEQKNLKEFVTAGGTLLVDAYAGSAAFGQSAKALIESLFGPLQSLDPASTLAAGRFQGGVDLTRGLRLKLPARRALAQESAPAAEQGLGVIAIQNRPAVLFSRFDLTAALAQVENYRAPGFQPESARKIVGNLLALATAD